MRISGKLLLALGIGSLLAVSTSGTEGRGDDCGMKTLEKGSWCEKCSTPDSDVLLTKADLDAKGNHKACGEKPKDVEVCVKKFYAASCHPSKTSEKPGS